jgi:hypothetical protein
MTTISRFQLNAIVRAGLIAASYYWPSLQVGQNIPLDASFSTMPVFSNRTLAVIQSQHLTTNPFSTNYPSGSLDVNGLPTTAYTVKVVDGVAQSDTDLQGTWCVKYTAASKVNVSLPFGGGPSLLTDTFSAGHGMVTFTYSGGAALVVAFDAPTTAIPEIYSPTTSATAITGGTPDLWDPVYKQSVGAYGYLRFMDVANANQDYVNKTTNTWPLSNDWSTRATPANYATSTIDGSNRGIPLEWMLDLCSKTGKPGWFNVPALSSDDYVTQYTTMIATTQAAGTQAMFECVGNEAWDFGAGFYTYQKRGVAALAETMFGTSVSIFQSHTQRVVGVTFDGTNATVQFLNPHGLSVGVSSNKIAVQGALTPYTGMNVAAASNTGFTVIDANNVSFACTVAASGGQIAGTTIFGATSSGVGGGVALNAASNLFTYGSATGAYGLGSAWLFRRSWQVAALIKAAWTAAGRSLSDCKTILPFQAGTTYANLYQVQTFLAGIFGQQLSSVFSAACMGGYYIPWTANGNVMNAGFGLTGTNTSAADSAGVLSQLRDFVDHMYGAYFYGSFSFFCQSNGLEMYVYETGLDTSAVSPAGIATTANADPLMEGITRDALQNLARIGFTRVGYYQCGAGTYAGSGCFNVGQTATEANYLSGAPSPKVKGILDAQVPPVGPVSYHAFPCTLSGYDFVGNEGVATTASQWPSFNGNYVTYIAARCAGPNNSGFVYEVWSEISRTATVTVNGHTIGGSPIVITAQSGSTTSNFTATNGVGSPTTGVTLGSCSVPLVPGPNYVLLSAPPAQSGNASVHSVQFS